MVGFPSPFGGEREDDELFDTADEFVPENLPSPGQFLEGQDVLTGGEHVEFHDVSEELFERRGVYDMTFGYNLAQLNLDRRHPDAGFRYAREADTPDVLRAEFTPTTPFCPQSDTLTKGAFRAWNGLSNEHEYDLVRVRVAQSHQQSETINEALEALEDTGDPDEGTGATGGRASGQGTDGPAVEETDPFPQERGSNSDAPF